MDECLNHWLELVKQDCKIVKKRCLLRRETEIEMSIRSSCISRIPDSDFSTSEQVRFQIKSH